MLAPFVARGNAPLHTSVACQLLHLLLLISFQIYEKVKFFGRSFKHMAHESRSKRVVKLNRNSDFAYDTSLNFLATSNPSASSNTALVVDTLRQGSSISDTASPVAHSSPHADTVQSVWSGINFLPHNALPLVNTAGNNQDFESVCTEGSRSLGQYWNDVCADDSDSGQCLVDGERRVSSTRYNFLDFYSLSASPTVRTDTSDMGHSDKEEMAASKSNCGCTDEMTCESCMKGLQGAEGTDTELAAALNRALGKIDYLSSEIKLLRGKVERLESSTSAKSSGAESDKPSSKSHKRKAKKLSVKTSKVEEEKLRQLKVMKDKLRDRNKGLSGDSSGNDSSDEALSLNMKSLRKKMSSRQKEACNSKLAARLRQTGAFFPEESEDTSTGTDSSSSYRDKKSKSRKKVKSGAKIKKRPVIRTELWPHIIANEDDGEEVSSENIGLAKFFSCFTFIMTTCGRAEAAGRAVLLHAVSSVLECLPWTEARAFHNLVMVKLEQGRMDWTADFSVLAEQFLDKKVRQNMRSNLAAGTSSSSKSNSSKSYGKGFNCRYGRSNNVNTNSYNSSTNNYNSNRNKGLYTVVCRQWNYGTCGFGDRCRKWHVCWSCAEGGKPGEQHRASSHNHTGGGDQSKRL